MPLRREEPPGDALGVPAGPEAKGGRAEMTTPDEKQEIGRRVRGARERAHVTQTVLAGRVGLSENMIKRIEYGQRNLTVNTATKICRALGLSDLSELYGPDVAMPVEYGSDKPMHSAAQEVENALTGYGIPSDQAVSVDWYEQAVHHAWTEWHASNQQRTLASRRLPKLLRCGHVAIQTTHNEERRKARAAFADLMHLAQAYFAWQGSNKYWAVIDRGYMLAEDADDPQAHAAGLLYTAFALRSAGREGQALDLLRQATDELEPLLPDGPDDARGLWGAVQLARASTEARHLRSPSAWTHVTAADRMAARLPNGYSHRHGFSAGHVALHRVWIPQCLGDATEALRNADDVDVDSIPSLNMRAAHKVHVAEALYQKRDHGALLALQQAVSHSAEAVQFSMQARQIVSELSHKAPNFVRSDARKLAEMIDVPV